MKGNEITIAVNPLLYPIEAIYGAAYVFLDKAYLFLDGDPKKSVIVRIRGKEKITPRQLKDLAGEFYNEILSFALRNQISKNNQKIREMIIARALFTPPTAKNEPSPKREWKEDKLGLALPWEQRYGKNGNNR